MNDLGVLIFWILSIVGLMVVGILIAAPIIGFGIKYFGFIFKLIL